MRCQRGSFHQKSTIPSWTTSSAQKSHDVVPLIRPPHYAKYHMDKRNTFQGQVNSLQQLVACSPLSAFMKKKSLIWLLVSIIFGHDSSYKVIWQWKTVGKLLKVLSHVLKISLIQTELLSLYGLTNACQLSVSSKPGWGKQLWIRSWKDSNLNAEAIWVLQQRCQIKRSCEHQPLINPSAIKHGLFSGWHFLSVSFQPESYACQHAAKQPLIKLFERGFDSGGVALI